MHAGKDPAEQADSVEEQELRHLRQHSWPDVTAAAYCDSQVNCNGAGTLCFAYKADMDQACSPLERQESAIAPLSLFRKWQEQKKQKIQQKRKQQRQWRKWNQFLESELREQEMLERNALA